MRVNPLQKGLAISLFQRVHYQLEVPGDCSLKINKDGSLVFIPMLMVVKLGIGYHR